MLEHSKEGFKVFFPADSSPRGKRMLVSFQRWLMRVLKTTPNHLITSQQDRPKTTGPVKTFSCPRAFLQSNILHKGEIHTLQAHWNKVAFKPLPEKLSRGSLKSHGGEGTASYQPAPDQESSSYPSCKYTELPVRGLALRHCSMSSSNTNTKCCCHSRAKKKVVSVIQCLLD